MREQVLSRVKARPWKSVRQLRPWTSSTQRRIFLKPWPASSFRSARLNSHTRPFRESEAIFVPDDLVTSVLPAERTLNIDGALMSYHSFLRKGSTIFFFAPFLPFVRRLFLPTAIVYVCVFFPGGDWSK